MHQFPTDPCVRAQCVQFVHRHRHDYKDLTLKKEKNMSVVKSVMEEYKIEMSVFKSDRRANTRFCYPSITWKDKPLKDEASRNFMCLHAYFKRTVLQ